MAKTLVVTHRGIPGPAGILALRGAWALDEVYKAREAVSHESGSYVARIAHTSVASAEPGVGVDWETTWMLLADRGPSGESIAPEFDVADLPPAAPTGSLAKVKDSLRGLWYKSTHRWLPVNRGVARVMDFGAIADGTSHPLSERYGSLGAAQAVYPHASSLTDEIDWAATQAAHSALAANGGRIEFDKGHYVFNRPLSITKGLVALIGLGGSTGDADIPGATSGNCAIWVNQTGAWGVEYVSTTAHRMAPLIRDISVRDVTAGKDAGGGIKIGSDTLFGWNSQFQDVLVSDFRGGTGIRLGDPGSGAMADRGEFRNVRVHNCQRGVENFANQLFIFGGRAQAYFGGPEIVNAGYTGYYLGALSETFFYGVDLQGLEFGIDSISGRTVHFQGRIESFGIGIRLNGTEIGPIVIATYSNAAIGGSSGTVVSLGSSVVQPFVRINGTNAASEVAGTPIRPVILSNNKLRIGGGAIGTEQLTLRGDSSDGVGGIAVARERAVVGTGLVALRALLRNDSDALATYAAAVALIRANGEGVHSGDLILQAAIAGSLTTGLTLRGPEKQVLLPADWAVVIGTAQIRTGTGTPEGVVTAPVGSMFLRTDGGAGTTLWVKETGAGNTGWTGK